MKPTNKLIHYQKRLSLLAFGIGLGVFHQAHAQLASQVINAPYKEGQYCTTDIQPDIPKGTPNKQFVADISCLKQQLKAYQANTLPANTRYQAYKAEAWLSYVAHEQSEASLTKAGHYALNEALAILSALQTNQVDKLPFTADIPPTSGLKRPDLWATLLTIKQSPAFEQLPKAVANSEVKLIWAEAEFCEFGWRHSREHFSAAERWVDSAEVTALNQATVDKQSFADLKFKYLEALQPLSTQEDQKSACQGAILPFIELPKPEPVILPTVSPIVVITPAIVHFALDKSNLDNSSHAVIDELLAKVKSHPDGSNFTFGLYGHTDSRASQAYNAALSKRRTESVAQYLQAQGVPVEKIAQFPEGETQLKHADTTILSHSLNRRVEIYVLKDGKPITNAQVTQTVMNQDSATDLKPEKVLH